MLWPDEKGCSEQLTITPTLENSLLSLYPLESCFPKAPIKLHVLLTCSIYGLFIEYYHGTRSLDDFENSCEQINSPCLRVLPRHSLQALPLSVSSVLVHPPALPTSSSIHRRLPPPCLSLVILMQYHVTSSGFHFSPALPSTCLTLCNQVKHVFLVELPQIAYLK